MSDQSRTRAPSGEPPTQDSETRPSCAEEPTLGFEDVLEIPGYRILGQLGEGGMGAVYLAEEEALGRHVAIKAISERLTSDEGARRRFLREARTMAAVEHPNIVRVYHLAEVAGRHFLVMEYVEGSTLGARILSQGRLEVTESLRILSEVVQALAAAWERGIIHRDLKPSNILLDLAGRSRVVDFGLAKSVQLPDDTDLTHAGQMLGTPSYVSPEQARGADVDFRADIYSLAMVLFEMLSGERPFRGTTPLEVVSQHVHAPLPSLGTLRPELPVELQELVEWMARKDPAERPSSYEELLGSIAALRAGEAPLAPLPPSGAKLPAFLSGEAGEEEPRPLCVARGAELEELDRRIREAASGDGRVAFVTGEAGTGKTTLVREFVRLSQETHEDLIVAIGGCSAHTGEGDPYASFRQLLSQLSGDVEALLASGVISREQGLRLWGIAPVVAEAVVDSGRDLVDTLLPGAELLARSEATAPEGAPWRRPLRELVERKAALPPDAGLQQAAVFMQVGRVLSAAARVRPLLLVLEDLHWADAGSIALLFQLGRELKGNRIVILGTYRPAEVALGRGGERHPLEPVLAELKGVFGEVAVGLAQAGNRAFVDAFIDSVPNRLGEGFRETLFRQTEGHPLFTVELLRTMQDGGMLDQDDDGTWIERSELDWGALPARVEGVVAARIERLPDDLRETLTVASVEGEEFTAEVVAKVRGSDARTTIRLLSRELEKKHRLVSARGVRALPGGRLSRYGFSHAIFQRYLYDDLSQVERPQLHEDVGTALEALYGDGTEEISPQLARHFAEAGITEKAVEYYRQAGERATRLLANEQAITLLERGLTLLETLPDTPERAGQELALQFALAAPAGASLGWASPSYGRSAARALELCDAVGQASLTIPALGLLIMYEGCAGDLRAARDHAQKAMDLAQGLEDPQLIALASVAREFPLLFLGELAQARQAQEQGLAGYESTGELARAHAFSGSVQVSLLTHLAITLLLQGFADQARRRCDEARAVAEALGHPNSTALAIAWAAVIHSACGDLEQLAANVGYLERFASEHGLRWFLGEAESWRGVLLLDQGRPDEGEAKIRAMLDANLAAGKLLASTLWRWYLSLAAGQAGRIEQGLEEVADGLALAETTGESLWEAELYRVKGELLVQAGEETEAEVSFRKAIDVARSQQARWWELRAATSLARLWLAQGKRQQAHDLLSPVYAWFTEGLDTAPLVEARELLEELSGKP